jgi:tripartite-type tricarboxylate transporter receptor subunit TctC
VNALIRRGFLVGAASLATAARAEDRPLRIVVGLPAGGGIDTVTRLIADKMRVSLQRTVVVENKPGAAGIVANMIVKQAAPDGSTLLMTPLANMVAFPHSYAKLDYDPFRDYVPVAHIAAFQLAFGSAPTCRRGRSPSTWRSPGAAAPTPISPRLRRAACRISSACCLPGRPAWS